MTGRAARGLACRGVASQVGDTLVLRDLDLSVPAGSMTTVVGPSGAGKTSLLRAVAGLAPVTAGSIHLGDVDLAGVAVHRRRLAVVFQEPRLFPSMSVADNVGFALRMAGTPRRQRHPRALELLDEVGLAGHGQRSTRGLSGGEAQRVALARALAGDPDLLLLDEPLSAVDPTRRESLRNLIATLQRQRAVTTLYVTHDRTEAAALGDRVALLLEGRIVQHAPPQDLFERPGSAVVARFFGSTNLVTGPVRTGRLQAPGVDLPVDGVHDRATVAIRPEHLELGEAAEPADGTITGRVVDVTYMGGRHRVEVDVQDLDGARRPDGVPALVAELPDRPEPGAPIRLRIAAERVWTLADPPAIPEPPGQPDASPNDRADVVADAGGLR